MFARSATLQPSINHPDLRFGKHGAVAPWQFRVDMPRLNVSRPNLLRDRSLFLAAGAALLVALAPAYAQDAGLRGEIAENQIWQDIRARRSPLDPAPVEQAKNNDAYAPESTGAIADEAPESRDTSASLFPDPKTDADTMGEPDEPDATPRGVRKRDEEPVAPEEPAAEEEEEGLATNTRAERVDAADEERNIRAEPENGRAEAIEGADIEPEDNPYAPLGLRVGTFNVTSTFEQGVTWTSNANYSPTPAPAFLSEIGAAAQRHLRLVAPLGGHQRLRRLSQDDRRRGGHRPLDRVRCDAEPRHPRGSAGHRQGWLRPAARSSQFAGERAGDRDATAAP